MVELRFLGVRISKEGTAPVEVRDVEQMLPEPQGQPVLWFQEAGDGRTLAIWIGPAEATAIAFALQGIEVARPMTHDLLKTVVTGLGATVERVVITDRRETTYYAEIELRTVDGSVARLDARPSDAVALAVRTGAPIFARESVLEDAA